MLHVIFALLAICCGMAALICVCLWARDDNSNAFLGDPEWTDKKFPSYHPVLMVSGFYFAQVLGICMWSLVPNHEIAKAIHATLMLGSIATMIAGLHAVVAYEHNVYVPSLTSMHSWVGVMTIIVFGLQVIGGFTMGTLSALGSTLPIMKHIVKIHRAIGLMSLMFTSVAILTGIENQLGGPIGDSSFQGQVITGTCGYTSSTANYEENADKYYTHIPLGCRIAYGVGVLVLLGTLFTGMAVYARSMETLGLPEKEVEVAHERAVMQSVPQSEPQGGEPEYTDIHTADPTAASNNAVVA
jgi:cytochrome b-561